MKKRSAGLTQVRGQSIAKQNSLSCFCLLLGSLAVVQVVGDGLVSLSCGGGCFTVGCQKAIGCEFWRVVWIFLEFLLDWFGGQALLEDYVFVTSRDSGEGIVPLSEGKIWW